MLASPAVPRKDWGVLESEGGRLLSSLDEKEKRNMEQEARDVRLFSKVYTLSQIIGVMIVGMIVLWLVVYRGGFAWTNSPKLEFNWHPLFMFLGLLLLYGNGILVYRAFRNENKRKLKIIHACFHGAAFLFAVIGLVAVFDSHNLNVDVDGAAKPIPNLYSLHSWMGLSVVILFVLQWLFGLATFLVPGLRPALRSFYMPIHQFFGLAIFLGATGTALLGLNEKAIFSISNYAQAPPEGVLVNFIGLMIVLFGGLITYLVAAPAFRRRATEDEILLADSNLD